MDIKRHVGTNKFIPILVIIKNSTYLDGFRIYHRDDDCLFSGKKGLLRKKCFRSNHYATFSIASNSRWVWFVIFIWKKWLYREVAHCTVRCTNCFYLVWCVACSHRRFLSAYVSKCCCSLSTV